MPETFAQRMASLYACLHDRNLASRPEKRLEAIVRSLALPPAECRVGLASLTSDGPRLVVASDSRWLGVAPEDVQLPDGWRLEVHPLPGGASEGSLIVAAHPDALLGIEPELPTILGALGFEAQARADRQTLAARERLAGLGRLISGVAHEIGGPLQAVVTLAEVLSRDPHQDDRVEAADRLLRSALRLRGITQELLAFGRPAGGPPGLVSVADCLMDALELDRFSELRSVAIDLELPDELPRVAANSHRLAQVFLNLLTNAREAIVSHRDSGQIGLTVEVAEESDRSSIRIRFSDDGPGVPPHLTERIFEPFFTTRPEGGGHGIGLAVCRSLIEEMGGALQVGNNSQGGATFEVILPVPEDQSSPSPPAPAIDPTRAPPQEALRVLLIDDDLEVLATYRAVLELEGHHVVGIDRGDEALKILRHADCDVVLCDMRLRDMDGALFLDALAGIRADLVPRTVFATGDVLGERTRNFFASVDNLTLIKPFQIEDLLAALQQAATR